MITENTKLARLIGEVLRLSDYGVESDERWAGVAELRQLLEGTRVEYSVPRQKDVCKHRSPPIASSGAADRRENGENADLAPLHDQRR
jgi:hypothetical protein